MHSDDGMLDALGPCMLIEQLPGLEVILLAYWHCQTFVIGSCPNSFSDGEVIFCLVHSAKAAVFDTYIEKPAMSIVQASSPLCSRGSQQKLVLYTPKGKGEVVQQEYGIIMGISQVMPERCQA